MSTLPHTDAVAAAPAATHRRRRVRAWAVVVAGFAAFSALVLLASLPTGANEATGVVADGSRLAARERLDDVWVFLVSDAGRLRLQVAYEGPKGWLSASLDPQSADVVAARSTTAGGGPIPPFTAVYGRAPGERVEVHWADGTTATVDPESDGSYVAVRAGDVRVDDVVVSNGAVVVIATGPL